MVCPHCTRTIAEQDTYLMSQRVPKSEPLPDGMRRLALVGGYLIAFVVLIGLFAATRAH